MRYSPTAYWGRQVAGVVLLVLAAVVVIRVLPPYSPYLSLAVLTGTSVAAVVIILSAYAKADEVILQTHKTAWFWGSMATLVVIAPIVMAVTWRLLPLPLLLPIAHHPADYFAEGILFLLLLQCAGFLILWAYYNLRRRG